MAGTYCGKHSLCHNSLGAEGQRSRSHKAEDRFGGLAEASCSMHLG